VLAAPLVVDGVEADRSEVPGSLSPWLHLWVTIRTSPSAVLGSAILVLLIAVAVLAPLIARFGVNEQVGAPFTSPTSAHWLGLDDGGIDMVSLLIWGLRVSLLVGFGATLLATGLGAVVGLVAGYAGGLVDGILMRLTDYFLVIPTLPLMIVLSDLWGASLLHIIIVIGVLSWTMTALVIRAQARSVRERVYVRRARSLGATDSRIIVGYILPQVLPLIVANTVLNISWAIFTETALAFLGLGDPSQVSLGTIIEHAFLRAAISAQAWWAIVPPGLLVVVIILACSFVGRAIEDALNPRLRIAHLSGRVFRLRDLPVTKL
jgi:peptide/nickel transport system permease protein